MLMPLYSHCYTHTCSIPQAAIFGEYAAISTPLGWNMYGRNSEAEVELLHSSALVGFLRKIVTSVHGYEQYKTR